MVGHLSKMCGLAAFGADGKATGQQLPKSRFVMAVCNSPSGPREYVVSWVCVLARLAAIIARGAVCRWLVVLCDLQHESQLATAL